MQNNFTTAEQSKRLLELGVPTDSADCYYPYEDSPLPKWAINGNISNLNIDVIPCWSVGRLIEIALICGPHWKFLKLIQACFQVMFHYKKPYVEAVIEQLFNAKDFKLDYSKLEE